ncbi:alginate export family protein [Pontiellaceae bacterium B12219]|nr:alginate export family protein [Pontiellaceae bacterium B12219]
MKHLLYAALLISFGAYAEETAKVTEPAEANVEESGGHKEWPSIDEWAEKSNLKNGNLSASVRLGYEYDNLSDNGLKAANALLTRTRVTYATDNEEGFNLMLQAQYVGPLNDTYGPENPNYDPIPDPEAFRFQQAYLAYSGYDSIGKIGAQEIILDNARFIGNVDWRFNAQSFNAGLLQNKSIENLTLLYAYADSINATNGEVNHDRQYNMFHGTYQLNEANQASAFVYLQENDNSANINTAGLRFWGQHDAVSYDAMAALQRDAYYGFLTGGYDFETFGIELGAEYISGGNDSRDRFQTLNGTAHAFNGWADQFLGTGSGLPAGLVDVWVQGTLSPMDAMDLIGVYHYFNTAADTPSTSFSGDYGQEIDAMLKYKVCKNFNALTGAAFYFKGDDAASNFTADETVFWVRGNFSF